jgi:hypothetical protein
VAAFTLEQSRGLDLGLPAEGLLFYGKVYLVAAAKPARLLMNVSSVQS